MLLLPDGITWLFYVYLFQGGDEGLYVTQSTSDWATWSTPAKDANSFAASNTSVINGPLLSSGGMLAANKRGNKQ